MIPSFSLWAFLIWVFLRLSGYTTRRQLTTTTGLFRLENSSFGNFFRLSYNEALHVYGKLHASIDYLDFIIIIRFHSSFLASQQHRFSFCTFFLCSFCHYMSPSRSILLPIEFFLVPRIWNLKFGVTLFCALPKPWAECETEAMSILATYINSYSKNGYTTEKAGTISILEIGSWRRNCTSIGQQREGEVRVTKHDEAQGQAKRIVYIHR